MLLYDCKDCTQKKKKKNITNCLCKHQRRSFKGQCIESGHFKLHPTRISHALGHFNNGPHTKFSRLNSRDEYRGTPRCPSTNHSVGTVQNLDVCTSIGQKVHRQKKRCDIEAIDDSTGDGWSCIGLQRSICRGQNDFYHSIYLFIYFCAQILATYIATPQSRDL